MSLGGAGGGIRESFFNRGLARALDVGAEELEVTTVVVGGGLRMGSAKGTSVLNSWLRSSPDTLGMPPALVSALSFEAGPWREKKAKCDISY